jgi:hypothetical protein
MSDPKVEITKITIKVGDKQAELTVQEAKELHRILDEMFKRQDVTYVPVYPTLPYYPIYPTWTYWTTCTSNGTFNITYQS